MHLFQKPLPPAVTPAEHARLNKSFTISDVQDWVERNGGIDSRLCWFEAFARNSEFYQTVAKPLLSMRSSGSIDVERRAKPLKDTFLTKKRNCLLDKRAAVLQRARENLIHLLNAKIAMNKKINEHL